jgi:hypothetical protein
MRKPVEIEMIFLKLGWVLCWIKNTYCCILYLANAVKLKSDKGSQGTKPFSNRTVQSTGTVARTVQ